MNDTTSLTEWTKDQLASLLKSIAGSLPGVFDDGVMEFLHFVDDHAHLAELAARLRTFEAERIAKEVDRAFRYGDFPPLPTSDHACAFKFRMLEHLLGERRRTKTSMLLLREVLVWLPGIGSLDIRHPRAETVAYSISHLLKVYLLPVAKWMIARVAESERAVATVGSQPDERASTEHQEPACPETSGPQQVVCRGQGGIVVAAVQQANAVGVTFDGTVVRGAPRVLAIIMELACARLNSTTGSAHMADARDDVDLARDALEAAGAPRSIIPRAKRGHYHLDLPVSMVRVDWHAVLSDQDRRVSTVAEKFAPAFARGPAHPKRTTEQGKA